MPIVADALATPPPRAAAPLLQAALLGALVAGLAEAILAATRSTTAGGAALPLAAIGLWMLVAPPLWIGGLLARALGRSATGRAVARTWTSRRAGLLAVAALIGLGTALLVLLAPRATAAVAARLKDRTLLPPAVAVLAAGTPALALILAPLWGPLARLLARLPPAAALGAAAACALGLPALAVVPPLRTLTKDLSLAPAGLLALGVVVAVARLAWPRGRDRRLTWAAAALATAVAVGGAFAWTRGAGARAALADGLGATPLLVAALQRTVDRDGDGFSPLLAGGDCDDADPTINPLALDLPQNGLDEDCDGADRTVAAARAAGVEGFPPVPEAFRKRWNVLVLTIDALRPDRMSVHGHERDTTPNMRRLAEHGLVFERAYAPANATRYAVPTTFAGRVLGDLDADWVGGYLVVNPGNGTLFERLQAAGWYTEAQLPAQQRDGMWFGLEAGFDLYGDVPEARLKRFSTEALNAKAVDLFERAHREADHAPWLLWMHYVEPHEPYHRHPDHDFGTGAIDRYDSEIAAVDAAIGELLGELERTGQRDRTMIVITSDHGEEFGEHGRHYHGHQLFDESVRVPLLIHVPGAPAKRVEAPVSTIDLVPTVANLVGLQPRPSQGARSHVGALFGDEAPDWQREVFTETVRNPQQLKAREVALVRWPYKAMWDLQKRRKRLFDLKADPAEQRDLAAQPPPEGAAVQAALEAEVQRQQDALLARLKARRVSDAPPAALGEPARVDPGLVWLGGRLSKRRFGDQIVHQAQLWFRAEGSKRPELTVRVEVFDDEGKRLRKWDRRALAGVYPMSRWRAGEVVELKQFMRFDFKAGRIAVKMSLVKGREVVAGPFDLGTVVHEQVAPPG